ncbi:MAG: acyltransferase family protein [Clostridiales bacterium]|nr:acyltransferase family protein [Clostridiales bacterium]
MRKHHIDNLRWIAVLMLFPYHIFMIYNSFGENFYIKGADIRGTTAFIAATWPWFMPLLFVIAGIGTANALQKRSPGAYAKERVRKLLIPLVAGLLLVIPAQTYFAERFHNGYTGGYFAQYILFFTKETDLSGYTGGFTPGQLWFILYLFLISMAAIPVILLTCKIKFKPTLAKVPKILLPLFFILPCIGSLVLDIAGKSLGEYFVYFMLGYFLLSKDAVQQWVEKWRFALLGGALACTAVYLMGWFGVFTGSDLLYDIFARFYAWLMILALLGLAGRYLNFSNKATTYLSRSSFAVYLFHQSWIIAVAYYVFQFAKQPLPQMLWILLFSVPATFGTYELARRWKVTRFLFGIK